MKDLLIDVALVVMIAFGTVILFLTPALLAVWSVGLLVQHLG